MVRCGAPCCRVYVCLMLMWYCACALWGCVCGYGSPQVRAVAYMGEKYLAAGSTEPEIRLISRKDTTKFVSIGSGKSGIKSLACDPRGEFLAATCMDG